MLRDVDPFGLPFPHSRHALLAALGFCLSWEKNGHIPFPKRSYQAFVLLAVSPGTPTFSKPCDLHQRFRCQVQLLTWPLVSWTKNYVTMARNQACPVTLQLHEENQPVDSCGHLPLCGGFDGNDHSQSGLASFTVLMRVFSAVWVSEKYYLPQYCSLYSDESFITF